jgi:rhodanese-related sulfurtransferase
MDSSCYAPDHFREIALCPFARGSESDRVGNFYPLFKTKIIVTICPHYDRAEIARTYLTSKGFRSKYLVNGAVGLTEYLRGDKARDFSMPIKK